MKKLNKLLINSDKIMKTEDLLTLRGSYGGGAIGFHVCISNFFGIVGCANALTDDQWVGLTNCRVCFGHDMVDYAEGLYTPAGGDCCSSW
jgi:hypothetical protein